MHDCLVLCSLVLVLYSFVFLFFSLCFLFFVFILYSLFFILCSLFFICCSLFFILYSKLCPSTTGSSPPPESSVFLCLLLSLSIPLPVAPQCHLSNDVLVFRQILPPFICQSVLLKVYYLSFGRLFSPFPFRVGYILDYVSHSGSLPNDGVTDSV